MSDPERDFVKEAQELLLKLVPKLDHFELMASCSFQAALSQITDGKKKRVMTPCATPSGEPKLLIYLSRDPDEITARWNEHIDRGADPVELP